MMDLFGRPMTGFGMGPDGVGGLDSVTSSQPPMDYETLMQMSPEELSKLPMDAQQAILEFAKNNAQAQEAARRSHHQMGMQQSAKMSDVKPPPMRDPMKDMMQLRSLSRASKIQPKQMVQADINPYIMSLMGGM